MCRAKDSEWIAYKGGPISESGVWLARPDGRDAHRLTNALGSGFAFTNPQWSPDGTRLAYYAGPDGRHDLELNISNNKADEYWPTWSPDGAWIAYDRWKNADGRNRIVIVRPDGSGERKLEGFRVDGSPPQWSPDARNIYGYLFSFDWGDYAIIVFDVSGESPPVIIETRGNAGNGNWQRPP